MDKRRTIEAAQTTADIAVREPIIKRQEQESINSATIALRLHQREKARRFFEVGLAWNRMLEVVQSWKLAQAEGGRPVYIVDSWLLQDLIRHLTPSHDEDISYVTGITLGRVRILSRICKVSLEKQSVVYARATHKSCVDALAEILEKGNRLHAMAHSHPGRGAGATHESSIDTNYLGHVQQAGADVIGIICSRDGFVRFFTVKKPFDVLVQGNGVTQIDEYVFQIELS